MVISIILFISNYYLESDECVCGKNNCSQVSLKTKCSRGSLIIATILLTLSVGFFVFGSGRHISLNTNLVTMFFIVLGITLITLNSIIINVSNKNENCSQSKKGGIIGLITGILLVLFNGGIIIGNNIKKAEEIAV
jgi:hypothetical protein